jgi:hypothetical protein
VDLVLKNCNLNSDWILYFQPLFQLLFHVGPFNRGCCTVTVLDCSKYYYQVTLLGGPYDISTFSTVRVNKIRIIWHLHFSASAVFDSQNQSVISVSCPVEFLPLFHWYLVQSTLHLSLFFHYSGITTITAATLVYCLMSLSLMLFVGYNLSLKSQSYNSHSRLYLVAI